MYKQVTEANPPASTVVRLTLCDRYNPARYCTVRAYFDGCYYHLSYRQYKSAVKRLPLMPGSYVIIDHPADACCIVHNVTDYAQPIAYLRSYSRG